MSTRATYEIDGHAFYIHYDGYPEGAALYFKQAKDFPRQRGGLAEKFLCANDLASFTDGHDAHGDTAYQYTYNSISGQLVVDHIEVNGVKECVFIGSLQTFIDTYARKEAGVLT